MMKKIENIILISFLFVLSFVPFLWLSGGQLVLGYDAVFPLNPIAFLTDRLYSWTTTQGFSMDQSGIQGSLIIHFIDSIPYFFGFSAEYAQKIVFSFWFFAILFSSFIFIIRIERSGFVKSRYLRYFFPVLYTFNFYLLQAWWAIERTKFSLVVALPLIFSIILPMVKEKLSVWRIFRYSVLCALILSIFNGGGWVGLPLFGGLFVMLGCYYVFFTFIFLLNKKIKEVVLINLFFVFFILWYILLNAYTLLPFMLTTIKSYGEIVESSGGITGLIDWSRYISDNVSLLNLFRLQGIPDWYNAGRFHPYSSVYLNNPFFIFISFLIPLSLFLSFIKKHRKEAIIIPFFLLTLIISAFLTAGAHPPLGFIFEFLMRTVPGFVVFRSAIFKFGYAYWFSISFFIGLALSNYLVFLIYKIKNTKLSNLTVIVAPIIICLILLYYFPYITGNIFRIESTSVSTRVSMPSYVQGFAKWWRENGKTDKILLLPKLNENWLFEQYRWNYMSLFPVTGNFASRGIIENAVILTGNETIAVNELYNAINSNDYEKMNSLSSDLGTRYFLVRRDFYYDYPDQETNDPKIIEKKLAQNPNIQHVVTFGEWAVYRLTDSKPMITTKNNSVLVSGVVDFDKLHILIGSSVFVKDQGSPISSLNAYSGILIGPNCLTCLAEKEEKQVIFPKPKILIDSKLYQVVELRDKLLVKENDSLGQRIDRLVGHSIKLVGQMEQLMEKDKEAYYIDIAKNKYNKIIKQISDSIQELFNKIDNPYYYAISIKQYLDQEEKLLSTFITSKVNDKVILKILAEVLHSIQDLKDKIANYYDADKSYNRERIYSFMVEGPGEYNIKLDKETIGNIEDYDLQSSLFMSLDKQSSRSGEVSDSYIDFGNAYLGKGKHTIDIVLPSQKSISSASQFEKIVGKNCYSSYVDNFSSKKTYVLRFNSKNDFDPSFFYFIDHGTSFSPLLFNRILIANAQVDSSKIVISSKTMSLDERAKRLRISFCASSLTEKLFKENIRDLSVVELTSPLLYLYQKINNNFFPAPKVIFKEINQTHFKVFVDKAETPYYLVFNQRNDLGWMANVGENIAGNDFQNIWYIDKAGDYEIDILYKPQKYFNVGVIISIIFFTITVFVVRSRKNV